MSTASPDKPILTRRIIADLDTPLSAYLKLAGTLDEMRPNSFLLESVEGGEAVGRYSFIGTDPDLIWRVTADGQAGIAHLTDGEDADFVPEDKAPLESLRALLAESRIDLPAGLPPMAAGLVGYLGYDMIREVEAIPDSNAASGLGLPNAVLIRPRLIAVFDAVTRVVTLVAPLWAGDSEAAATARLDAAEAALNAPLQQRQSRFAADVTVPEPDSNTSRLAYHDRVEKAKEYIRAGDIFQVVPSQRFSLPFDRPAVEFYRVLRRVNPSPFLFHLQFDGFAVSGSSPEIMVRKRDGKVTIRPLAGTRKRGVTPEEDKALEEELLADPKELAEHLMLLDLGRNDVGRVSEIGTVRVTEQMIVERYSHVMHIVSNVEGDARKDADLVDILMAGFPAGTVSGAPKIRAMEIIDELEDSRRGVYGGCVGYFGADGDMDSCICLRTAVIKDGKIYVQAGGGVVADSDPEAEYQETRNKAMALLKAAAEAMADGGEA